ncbi:MAG: DNA polymerase III subunit gamma/tau [Verrucomicrobia bacterium]|nr:MAG: DNA polymerase III subunit gamma/tau [Verrucomicrobiota bacterium]
MSYQVIARKYRPQRFSDVVGQEHVTQTLANAIKQSRIAHAYLFCGPRGTGKTTIARIFAKCLNCTGGPKVDFDDDDPRCLEIADGRSLDVIEIDGASNRGIEEIRELRDTVKYAPATSKFKLYIIDEVHMLTKEAFNALLKTLEEPPGHVKFMFATTEPEKVLPTILSRCQRFDLRRIPAALIVRHLAQIAKQEKVKIDDAALHAIARGADGGMRDAESTLDQLISFCGEKIQESDVLSMFGLTARSQILDLSRAILAGEVETSLRQLNELAKHGKDLGRLLSDLLNHFRNLLIFQVSNGDLRLLEVSETEAASLGEQASGVGSEALTRIMEVLTDCETRLRDAVSKKILIEVALLKAIESRNAASIDTVLKRLEESRRDNNAREIVSIPMPAPTPAPPPNAPPPVRAAGRAAASTEPASLESTRTTASLAATNMSAGSDGELERLWHQVVDAVGRASPFTRSYLLEAHPVLFDQNLLTIGFDPEFADHLQLVDNAKNRTLIQTKLSEFGFSDAQVKFVRAEARANRPRPAEPPVEPASPSATAAAAPAAPKGAEERAVPSQDKPKPGPGPFNQEDFKNDPLIQKALEIFKGQIIEVRA